MVNRNTHVNSSSVWIKPEPKGSYLLSFCVLVKMPILYALVARGKNVLAEYTSAQGNFPTVTRVLLSKIPDQDGKMSYVYDSHVFHYVVDNGITFLCMADEGMKRRLTFAFLDEIKRLWRHEYTAIEQTALAFSLNDQFSPVLRQQIVCILTSSSKY
jgi:hypothetical protein